MTSGTPFSATTTGPSRLALAGDLDEGHLPGVRRLLAPMEEAGGVLDLSALTFFPSLAVGVVVQSALRAARAGRHLRLVAAPGTLAATVLTIAVVDFDPGPMPRPPRTRPPVD